ncbi:MAG: TIGR02452 family protein [Treponema sp.]|nr:TIGR02452 family protein [Treponema sp.]
MEMTKEWNANWWIDVFTKASEAKDNYLIHDLRRDVIQDTKRHCMNGSYVINGRKVVLKEPADSRVFNNRIHVAFFSGPDLQTGPKVRIHVLNEDCLATARRLAENGITPLVLNMASRHNPGGGVENGAGAQEECLFRSSNYFQTLYKKRDSYPLDRNWGSVLSPEVTVFRGLESDGYPLLEKPFVCDFVAVPAINRPTLDENGKMSPDMVRGTENKIRTIYDTAYFRGSKTLVLSAFGCGAFRNPPAQIAKIFKDMLSFYDHTFTDIYFSIKPDHNDPSNSNFKAFDEIYKDWNEV